MSRNQTQSNLVALTTRLAIIELVFLPWRGNEPGLAAALFLAQDWLQGFPNRFGDDFMAFGGGVDVVGLV